MASQLAILLVFRIAFEHNGWSEGSLPQRHEEDRPAYRGSRTVWTCDGGVRQASGNRAPDRRKTDGFLEDEHAERNVLAFGM